MVVDQDYHRVNRDPAAMASIVDSRVDAPTGQIVNGVRQRARAASTGAAACHRQDRPCRSIHFGPGPRM
jgi:hypothetical protein